VTAICSVVDDDAGVLDATASLLRSKGIAAIAYPSAELFLDAPVTLGCIVSDIRMPGLSGLDLLRTLRARFDARPVIFATGYADVRTAVWATQNGAFDYVEKPCDYEQLTKTVKAALKRSDEHHETMASLAMVNKRFGDLTDRQKEVMFLTVRGFSSKEATRHLSISPRTVETYRFLVMHKMEVKSLAELIRVHDQLKSIEAFRK